MRNPIMKQLVTSSVNGNNNHRLLKLKINFLIIDGGPVAQKCLTLDTAVRGRAGTDTQVSRLLV